MPRSALYRGDAGAVVALAPRAPGPDDGLQLLGDGLAAALAQDLEGAADRVRWPVLGRSESEASTRRLPRRPSRSPC